MNTLVSTTGPSILAQLRAAAVGVGSTEELAPSSITYYLGPKSAQSYDPDQYDGTYTWAQTATITNALVGGFDWRVIANAQNVKESDIKVVFAHTSLNTAPTAADECLYNSKTYRYVGHRSVADLYMIHMELKTGAQ